MYLGNMRIAVVENATSLLDCEYGSFIDAHDVVIRMNRGVPLVPSSQGKRSDLLVFSVFSAVHDDYQKFGAKHFMWMSPKRRDEIGPDTKLPENMTFYCLDRWQVLNELLGSRPSVGAMTLDFLTTTDPASVSIFGFDFKRSGTNYHSRRHIGPHDYTAEKQFCMNLAKKPGWHFIPC